MVDETFGRGLLAQQDNVVILCLKHYRYVRRGYVHMSVVKFLELCYMIVKIARATVSGVGWNCCKSLELKFSW